MKIIIRQPLAFSEIGRKDNQEDALYPNPSVVTTEQRVFIMCDGMGGHEHGEVASNTIATALGQGLDQSDNPCADFERALAKAYDALDAKDTNDGGKKMGTTMTCLILDEQGAFVAHIGDSRIYQIRPSSGLLHQTSDHSLAFDLWKAGELSEEERDNFPQKNIITRAIQPNQERRTKAETCRLNNIEAGDYFFLCCDGVLEQLTNQRLCEILSLPIPDKDKLTLIKSECDGKTKDNYTCWLVPVDRVEGERPASDDNNTIIATTEVQETVQTQSISPLPEVREAPAPPLPAPQIKPAVNKQIITYAICSLAVICIGWLVYTWKNRDTPQQPPQEEVTQQTLSPEVTSGEGDAQAGNDKEKPAVQDPASVVGQTASNDKPGEIKEEVATRHPQKDPSEKDGDPKESSILQKLWIKWGLK